MYIHVITEIEKTKSQKALEQGSQNAVTNSPPYHQNLLFKGISASVNV